MEGGLQSGEGPRQVHLGSTWRAGQCRASCTARRRQEAALHRGRPEHKQHRTRAINEHSLPLGEHLGLRGGACCAAARANRCCPMVQSKEQTDAASCCTPYLEAPEGAKGRRDPRHVAAVLGKGGGQLCRGKGRQVAGRQAAEWRPFGAPQAGGTPPFLSAPEATPRRAKVQTRPSHPQQVHQAWPASCPAAAACTQCGRPAPRSCCRAATAAHSHRHCCTFATPLPHTRTATARHTHRHCHTRAPAVTSASGTDQMSGSSRKPSTDSSGPPALTASCGAAGRSGGGGGTAGEVWAQQASGWHGTSPRTLASMLQALRGQQGGAAPILAGQACCRA